MQFLASFLLLLLMTDTLSTRGEKEARHAAAEWANRHLEEVFDAVMPNATAQAVQMPMCRVTTLRVRGSLDTFDYAVRLVEPCPTVNPDGLVTGVMPTGEFMIAEGGPIADQLARLRLETPDISAEAAIPRIRIRRVELKPSYVEKLLADITSSVVSPTPSTDIALASPVYEVAAATGIATRVFEFTAADRGSGERRLVDLATRAPAAHGFQSSRLRYDASFWD